ncbi:metallophosphoesterase [Lactococcus hodotermopsidis]|uniref:Metallophosphoesterase n=1 Tax=Pseudolactococcus hodotermopsidis TaxID=2709157 RepID=A0A6A0BCD1_9LACT|nr:DNA repair exonuclease [Lactococcus hodotermopsidis]GFH42363.1 metallophosphoesterase [Lactococcus hodotermopsidis]
MKFIHTADLHLDREFEGVVQKTPYRPYKILEMIIDFAISEAVDLVLFVGDNFHCAHPSIKIQSYFADQLARLAEHEIQAAVIFGNHDYYRESVYWIEFPENVTVFKQESVESATLCLKNGEKVTISGFSYKHAHIYEDKISEYPSRNLEGNYHIGLFHGEFSGNNFAPANLSDMLAKDYDYWALGHIHLANQMARNVIYPGTPQGRTKKEQTNFVVLGTLTASALETDFHDLAEIHFETLTLDLSLCDTLAQALTFIKSNLTETTAFYSLIFENYEKIAENLQEAIGNDGLIEELRQHYVIVKLRLQPLLVETVQARIVVPDFTLPAIDFAQIFTNLPPKKEIQKLLGDSDFQAEVMENLQLFASQQFDFENEDKVT